MYTFVAICGFNVVTAGGMYPNVSLISPILCKFNEESHWTYIAYCILYMLFCLTSVLLLFAYAIPRIRQHFGGNGDYGQYKRMSTKKPPRDSPILRRLLPVQPDSSTKHLPEGSDSEH